MAKRRTLEAEVVELSSLRPHPRNYQEHGEDQLAHIRASIEENGVYRPVVVASDSTILAGHGVVKALAAMGTKEVPVARMPFGSDDPRALRLLAGDNEIGRGASRDDRILSEILRGLAVESEGLLGTGFNDEQLAALLFVTRPASEIATIDAAREWVGLPEYDAAAGVNEAEFFVTVRFVSREDRDRFVAEKGLEMGDKRGDRRWSTEWPFRGRKDLKSVKFESEE